MEKDDGDWRIVWNWYVHLASVCEVKRFFDPKTTVYLPNGFILYFPPIEKKERWESIDVGFCARSCIWKHEDILPFFTGKMIEVHGTQKISRDGFLEVNVLLAPIPFAEIEMEELDEDVEKREDHERWGFLEGDFDWIHWNRFQLLYFTGRISKEDFIRYYVHSNTIWSLFKIEHPVYIGRKAYVKFIDNVLVPAHDRLAETGKAVVELEDFRELGVIEEEGEFHKTTCKLPVRVRIWDWDRFVIFPLPTKTVTFAEDDFYSFPTPEEVKAMGLDLALSYENDVRDMEQQGYNKKGHPFYNDYISRKESIWVYREVFPAWWEDIWNLLKKVGED